MMEHAPSMASKNSRMAVHTQTLHIYMTPKKREREREREPIRTNPTNLK